MKIKGYAGQSHVLFMLYGKGVVSTYTIEETIAKPTSTLEFLIFIFAQSIQKQSIEETVNIFHSLRPQIKDP